MNPRQSEKRISKTLTQSSRSSTKVHVFNLERGFHWLKTTFPLTTTSPFLDCFKCCYSTNCVITKQWIKQVGGYIGNQKLIILFDSLSYPIHLLTYQVLVLFIRNQFRCRYHSKQRLSGFIKFRLLNMLYVKRCLKTISVLFIC